MPRVASVTDVIYIQDFDTVWNFLQVKFGYSKHWRIECEKYLTERSNLVSKPDPVLDFLTFCCEWINPLLNEVMCRHRSHPTFMKIVFWLVRERLENVGWIRFSENDPF
jgi:hypothetical protein